MHFSIFMIVVFHFQKSNFLRLPQSGMEDAESKTHSTTQCIAIHEKSSSRGEKKEIWVKITKLRRMFSRTAKKHFANWIIKINYQSTHAFQLKRFCLLSAHDILVSSPRFQLRERKSLHFHYLPFSTLLKASCKLLANMQEVDKRRKQ